jgi:hypothetical protein
MAHALKEAQHPRTAEVNAAEVNTAEMNAADELRDWCIGTSAAEGGYVVIKRTKSSSASEKAIALRPANDA